MTEEQKEELCKIGEDEFQHLSESYYKLHEKYYKLQQENQSLITRVKTVKRNRKAEKSKVRKLREIITIKDRALHNKNKVLNEVREYIKEKELKDIKGNTLYCEENLIWHELALILAKVGDPDES